MRHWRRNADDDFRAAERRFYTEGTDQAFDLMIHAAIRTGNLLNLSAGAFVRALSQDPFLIYHIPDETRAELRDSLNISFVTQRHDWFPGHTDPTTCPRGHQVGWLIPPSTLRVRFALLEINTPLYRTVIAAEPHRIEIELGDWDQGEASTHVLVCDVCSATWPIDFNQVEPDYV